MPRLIFFTVHRTTPWWKYLASQIDFADVTVLSDLRGEGDYTLVDDFYRFMRSGDPAAVAVERFGEDGCADIILRCRSLRNLDRARAMKMIGGHGASDRTRLRPASTPGLIVTFTMDRYVIDVMARIARGPGRIDLLEMTSSPIPGRDHLSPPRPACSAQGATVAPGTRARPSISCARRAFAPVYVQGRE